MAVLGLPGVKRDGIRVGRGLRDTRSPPEAFAGLEEAGSGARCIGGGFGRRRSPVRSRWHSFGRGSGCDLDRGMRAAQ